ncbi:DUF397 domain-containing protein [Streptomyces sp. NPDC054813]
MAEHRGAVSWRRSSYSNTSEGNCCEIAVLSGQVVVRDSKHLGGAVVTFRADAWRAAIALFLARDGTGQSYE